MIMYRIFLLGKNTELEFIQVALQGNVIQKSDLKTYENTSQISYLHLSILAMDAWKHRLRNALVVRAAVTIKDIAREWWRKKRNINAYFKHDISHRPVLSANFVHEHSLVAWVEKNRQKPATVGNWLCLWLLFYHLWRVFYLFDSDRESRSSCWSRTQWSWWVSLVVNLRFISWVR